ncbi:hypothetical protein [Stratiformator vulcanicus]|nr:hypothetical protein [Stratiformator vulcanicus]
MSIRAAVPLLGGLILATTATSASAQFFGGNDPCGCQTASAPVYTQNVCQQTAMVVQPCYQQVPVTEYQEVRQTVSRPVVETKYVDREVTEYVPVTENRTASVPVTQYTPVTEYQTVMQDRSYYRTNYTPNCRVSPCQYDPRPGVLGWLNRTGYNIRSAFAPKYTAQRQYVQNQVAMQVPVTRQVAQHGTRQVNYQVTKMVPRTTTRKVAVNEVKYVQEEVTGMRPVTVMRTVPVGTSVAYAPGGATTAFGGFGAGSATNVAYGPIQWNTGSSATALGPTPDPNFSRSADLETIRKREADRRNDKFKREKTDDDFGRYGPEPTSKNIRDEARSLQAPVVSELKVPSFTRLSDGELENVLRERGMIADHAGHVPTVAVAGITSTVKAHRWNSRRNAASAGPSLAMK